MRVLIVGSGGREHALAWKLAQSPRVEKIFVAPGNGGTTTFAENVAIGVTDIRSLTAFAAFTTSFTVNKTEALCRRISAARPVVMGAVTKSVTATPMKTRAPTVTIP